jgi:hypothetical protein
VTSKSCDVTVIFPVLAVGQAYQGGIIAWVDNTGRRGLIAAPNDLDRIYAVDEADNVCDDLIFNGYDDWRLPTKDELNRLYQNKNLIGGFKNAIYWSSTIWSGYNYDRWAQNFGDGTQFYTDRYKPYNIRAVRSF